MQTVKIEGMSCQHCVRSVKEALEAVPGISKVEIDLEKGEARYEGEVDSEVIKDKISSIGFTVKS